MKRKWDVKRNQKAKVKRISTTVIEQIERDEKEREIKRKTEGENHIRECEKETYNVLPGEII